VTDLIPEAPKRAIGIVRGMPPLEGQIANTMRRRDFITLFVGAAGCRFAARAQLDERLRELAADLVQRQVAVIARSAQVRASSIQLRIL
jgi:hypothetical protein